MLLDFLVPKTDSKTYIVPVSTDISQRVESDGVLDRCIIAKQTRATLDILSIANPDKVVTLGGECSVSAPVFSYLANRYDRDVAIVWVNAHPDITLPGDDYNGYHAMALTACMGMGDSDIVDQLRGKVSPKDVCLAGLRDTEYLYIAKRIANLGITHFSPSDLSEASSPVIEWLKSAGKSKVVVHLDMDVMALNNILTAVADVPEGRMKLHEAVSLIIDIANAKELVALTVAEPMPCLAIRLKSLLASLPLI